MAAPYKKQDQVLLFKLIFFIILFTSINYQIYAAFNNQEDKFDHIRNSHILYISQGPSNDTTAPVITFIQPEINNTIIRIKSYTIIVNITDENPPLFGNVTFQLSNFSTFLFNASMSFMGGNQWNFNWDNISLYPNKFYTVYILQIIAIDSSSNYNLGMSGEIYIYLNVPGESPGILNIFLYLIIVCLLFAGIIVYLNRKIFRKVAGKELKDNK
ncbi:MAG: hypothetical protein ACFFAV_07750 [Candidatus Hermodarchaeota archaeon]